MRAQRMDLVRRHPRTRLVLVSHYHDDYMLRERQGLHSQQVVKP
jgi:hypothetical protein